MPVSRRMRKRIRRGIALSVIMVVFLFSMHWVLEFKLSATLFLEQGNITTPAIMIPTVSPPPQDYRAIVTAPIATIAANRVELRTNGRCTYTTYADDDTIGTVLMKRLRLPDYLGALVRLHAQQYPSVKSMSSKVKPGWKFIVPCPESMTPLVSAPGPSKEATACMYAKDPTRAYLLTFSGERAPLSGAQVRLRTSQGFTQLRTSDEKGALCFTDIKDGIKSVEFTYGAYQTTGTLSQLHNRHFIPLRVHFARESHRLARMSALLGVVALTSLALVLLILLRKRRIRLLQEEIDKEQLEAKKHHPVRKFTQQFPYKN